MAQKRGSLQWHEGIHYQEFCSKGNVSPPDKGGLDNGEKATIEVVGFNVKGRLAFSQYWTKGSGTKDEREPSVPPIKSSIMGTTSWQDSQKFLREIKGPLVKGKYVNSIGYDKSNSSLPKKSKNEYTSYQNIRQLD